MEIEAGVRRMSNSFSSWVVAVLRDSLSAVRRQRAPIIYGAIDEKHQIHHTSFCI